MKTSVPQPQPPNLPLGQAPESETSSQNLDQVILVNKNDQEIGVMDKVAAHRHPAQLHRASSVLLFRQRPVNRPTNQAEDSRANPSPKAEINLKHELTSELESANKISLGNQNKLNSSSKLSAQAQVANPLEKASKLEWLIQQRSAHKITEAHQWANACCGNLRPGESYLSCAKRRLFEELGIKNVKLKKLQKFTYQVKCNSEFGENEIDTVFIGEYDGPVTLNPLEVQAVKWVAQKDLIADLTTHPQKYSAWTKLVLATYPDLQL